MYNKNFFYLVFISFLLFNAIYGLTKDEVLKLTRGHYYCKDDICVSIDYSNDLDTIIIPNKEGKKSTYIIDTCSSIDIGLNLCSSKNCTTDSQCLSNKCIKGHCSFNEANPITECQYVRTIHDDKIFGDALGMKMQCGLPKGDRCKTNNDCSSYNCETYNNKNICGYEDNSGFHSTGPLGSIFLIIYSIPFILIIGVSILSCICLCVDHRKKSNKRKKNDFYV